MSRTIVVLAGTIVFTLSGGTSALIVVGSGSGGDRGGASGVDALAQASAAALAVTGGGRVTDTEVQDEESYYEVEITFGDGEQVDVHLDRSFDLVDGYPDVDRHPDVAADGDGPD